MGNKKRLCIIIITILVIFIVVCGVYMYMVILPKQEAIKGTTVKVEALIQGGNYKEALGIMLGSNTSGNFTSLIEDTRLKLKGVANETLEEKLLARDFKGGLEYLKGLEGYLLDEDYMEFEGILTNATYADTMYRVGSMLYSLNLSKELVVALTDIVYNNWDKDAKLEGKDGQIKSLMDNKVYADRLATDLGLSKLITSVDATDTTSEEVNETETVVDKGVNSKYTGNGVVVDSDIDALIVNLFNTFNDLYNELIGSKNDKLNYKKDIQLLSVKFDKELDGILSKSMDIKTVYNGLSEKDYGVYKLDISIEESSNED